ncbi:hypothetical protein [Streptococcus sp. DD13]|uniref:hypothetical protein n=1 Tax=Streptococcus sp. DD13 TaxID=1777881 RepID=UPI000799E54B|nr:hypothetical protein [Streptococcus sp. DD13]KXT77993.1 Phage protein [Streptococcus sp. DD13]
MDKQRLSFLITALVGFIASLLPWSTLSGGSYYTGSYRDLFGFDRDGKLTVFLFLFIAIIALIGYISTQMAASLLVTEFLLGLVIVVIAFLDIISVNNLMGYAAGLSVGYGLWITLVAAIAVVVIPFALPPRLSGAGFSQFFENVAKLFKNPNPRPVIPQAAYPGQAPQFPGQVPQGQAPYTQPVQPQAQAYAQPQAQAPQFPGQAPQAQAYTQPVQPQAQAYAQPQAQAPQFPGQAPQGQTPYTQPVQPQEPVAPVFPNVGGPVQPVAPQFPGQATTEPTSEGSGNPASADSQSPQV